MFLEIAVSLEFPRPFQGQANAPKYRPGQWHHIPATVPDRYPRWNTSTFFHKAVRRSAPSWNWVQCQTGAVFYFDTSVPTYPRQHLHPKLCFVLEAHPDRRRSGSDSTRYWAYQDKEDRMS